MCEIMKGLEAEYKIGKTCIFVIMQVVFDIML